MFVNEIKLLKIRILVVKKVKLCYIPEFDSFRRKRLSIPLFMGILAHLKNAYYFNFFKFDKNFEKNF